MSETTHDTEQSNATPEALQRQIDALRAKNAELLGKLKAAQTARDEAQTALEAAQAAASEAQEQVVALRLDAPVAALLDEIAIDGELFQSLFQRHYRFALDDNGAVVILDAEGKPAMVTEPDRVMHAPGSGGKRHDKISTPGDTRPAAFTANDVRRLAESCPDADKLAHVLVASRADGGGAMGSRSVGAIPMQSAPKPDKPQPQPFGLR